MYTECVPSNVPIVCIPLRNVGKYRTRRGKKDTFQENAPSDMPADDSEVLDCIISYLLRVSLPPRFHVQKYPVSFLHLSSSRSLRLNGESGSQLTMMSTSRSHRMVSSMARRRITRPPTRVARFSDPMHANNSVPRSVSLQSSTRCIVGQFGSRSNLALLRYPFSIDAN